jgi:hypothetical protein
MIGPEQTPSSSTFRAARWALLALAVLAAEPARPREERARHGPVVLTPDESAVAVARVQVRSCLFTDTDPPKLLILGKDLEKPRKDGLFEPPIDPRARDRTLKTVPLKEFDKGKYTPALRVQPMRMAVIAASFPYKKQIEEFRYKLRLPRDEDVLTERLPGKAGKGEKSLPAFRFLGVEAQRRDLDRDGKAAGKWVSLDLDGDYEPWRIASGRTPQPDDPVLAPLLVEGLAMPRLKLLNGRYPPVEMRLKNFHAALEKLKAQGKGARPDHCLLRVIDVTVQPGRAYQYRLRVRMANPNHGRKDVAEPALARASEIVSGWYEVPHLVVMAPELIYYAIDQKAGELQLRREERLTGRFRYTGPYANDIVAGRPFNRATMVWLQAHKWLEQVSTGYGSPVPVGEWSVAERVPVYRGEPVAQIERVEVPYWRTLSAMWLMADDGKDKKRPGVNVLFGHSFVNYGWGFWRGPSGIPPGTTVKVRPEAILVDFHHGSVAHERPQPRARPRRVSDDSAGEVLILRRDGKLILREGARDATDPERIERLARVRERLQAFRKKDKPSPFGKE